MGEQHNNRNENTPLSQQWSDEHPNHVELVAVFSVALEKIPLFDFLVDNKPILHVQTQKKTHPRWNIKLNNNLNSPKPLNKTAKSQCPRKCIIHIEIITWKTLSEMILDSSPETTGRRQKMWVQIGAKKRKKREVFFFHLYLGLAGDFADVANCHVSAVTLTV